MQPIEVHLIIKFNTHGYENEISLPFVLKVHNSAIAGAIKYHFDLR